MTLLEPRHVDAREAARLGTPSGWYGTKASGTFVIGPYPSEQDCLKEIGKHGPISQDQIL
jgi:hypothetical protein